MGRVIQRQFAQNLIAQFDIQPDCRLIVDCCFQVHLLAAAGAQTSFALLNEPCGQPEATGLWQDIESQDAPDLLDRLCHGETGNYAGKLGAGCVFSDQRYCFAPGDKTSQVHLCEGDAWWKAGLVDLPKAAEVFGAKWSDVEVHKLSVQAVPDCAQRLDRQTARDDSAHSPRARGR